MPYSNDLNTDDDCLPYTFVAFFEERRVYLMKYKQDSPEQRDAIKKVVDQFFVSYFDPEEIEKIKPKLQLQLLEYIKENINNSKPKNPTKFQWCFPRNIIIGSEKKPRTRPYRSNRPKRPLKDPSSGKESVTPRNDIQEKQVPKVAKTPRNELDLSGKKKIFIHLIATNYQKATKFTSSRDVSNVTEQGYCGV